MSAAGRRGAFADSARSLSKEDALRYEYESDMNRDTLIARVAETTKWSRKDVERILLAALEEIMTSLRRGEEVTLVGFGQFLVTTRRPRRGVNPRNPEQGLQIPAVKVVKFRAGKNLKDAARHGA